MITLKAKTIHGSASGPHLLITGGVHGDEFEPMVAIRRLMRDLKAEQLNGLVTLVPVVNEAAYERRHRCAEDGLDLARICPGRPDGSVTEKTAWALSELIRQADYYIDLHTGGTTLSVYPMAGYSLDPRESISEVQRRMARAFNLPIVWGTSPLEGRSLSVAQEAGIPAIYTEYLGSAICTESGIEIYVDGCLNVMAELGMIERSPPPSRVKHIVEDLRTQSGFMQIQNPAPVSGYFDSRVELGQHIQDGDLIGTICDPLGEATVEVFADQSGMVLMLKTFPYVEKNEGLAVILEVDADET